MSSVLGWDGKSHSVGLLWKRPAITGFSKPLLDVVVPRVDVFLEGGGLLAVFCLNDKILCWIHRTNKFMTQKHRSVFGAWVDG